MPIIRDFIFETDDETGLSGLKPTWIGDATPAQSIAHDVLEHRLKEPGSPVTAELHALGAILALRIENGAFYGGRSPAEVMAYMVFEMLLDMCRGKSVTPSGKTRPITDLEEWAEELLQQALPMAFELADRHEDHPRGLEILRAEHWDDIVGWIRRGYRYARKRYQHVDRYYVANSLFKRLDQATEDFVHQESLENGDRVRVSICPRRGAISFKANGEVIGF